MDQALQQQIGPVVANLFNGVLDRADRPAQWEVLLRYRARISDYVGVIGLWLEVDEAEGFAYLRQAEESADADVEHPGGVSEVAGAAESLRIPRLIRRRPLSYPVSLLCVLLRKKQVESDSSGDQRRLIISRDELVEMLRVFLPERHNQARVLEQIDGHIKKVADLGLIKPLKHESGVYEVRRVLRVLVDASWLADLSEKLKEYRDHAAPPE